MLTTLAGNSKCVWIAAILIILIAFAIAEGMSSNSSQTISSTMTSVMTATLTSIFVSTATSTSTAISVSTYTVNQATYDAQKEALIEYLQDKVYRLMFPLNISTHFDLSQLVDNTVSPFSSVVKSRIPDYLSPTLGLAVDGASRAVKLVLEAKLRHFEVPVGSATRLSPGIYNVTFTLSVPVPLGEIPELYVVQKAIGDITVDIQVPGTIQIDFVNGTISFPQLDTGEITATVE